MVTKIAYTDSWVIHRSCLNPDQLKFMANHAVHYVGSEEPLGTLLEAEEERTCPAVSAGHPKHEYTTGYAQEKIFEQFGYRKA